MGRKPNPPAYVISQQESEPIAPHNSTRTFSITLSEREWLLADLLSGNRVVPTLDSYLNKAVGEYLHQLSLCIGGLKSGRPDENQYSKPAGKRNGKSDQQDS